MSILAATFPMADPSKWLIFSNPWQDRIDPVFAGRLAALAQEMGKKINVSSGFRSRQEQENSYKNSRPGYAAAPGTSWHEFGMAIDTSDLWLKAIDKDAATSAQSTLKRFGIFKPLTKGNGMTVLEDWHIQPIETLGKGQGDKQKFFYGYIGGLPMDAKTFQMITGLLPDGVVGPRTLAKMQEVKTLIDSYVKPTEVNILIGDAKGSGILYNNKTYGPLRWIAETLGKTVNWDDSTKTAKVV